MKALFPYIGESILKSLIETAPSHPSQILAELRLNETANIKILMQVPLLFPNATVSFDGFQNLDIGIQINDAELLPIEVKLGRKGLHRSNINKLLRDGCSVSKHGHVTGNMLAVLDRRFDGRLLDAIGSERLHAKTDNFGNVPVTETWGLLARSEIISRWKSSPPEFNVNPTLLCLEEVCDRIGRDRFNQVAAGLLRSTDYYKDWIIGGG